LNPSVGTVRRATAVGALLCALSVVAVVHARPAGAVVSCGPPPAGSASVAVVVDTGSGEPLVRCVTVKEGATGRDALVAAGIPFRVGSGTPADNNQGGAFLCGILGVPQSGCAAPSAQGVSYWAYYRQAAGAAWTYSRVGFFTPVTSRCAVEGWRWTTAGGVAASDNPRPRVAPPVVSCSTASPPAAPSTTVAPSAQAPAATPAPAPAVPAVPAAPAAPVPTTTAATVPLATVPAAEVAGRTTEAPASPSTTTSGGRPSSATSPAGAADGTEQAARSTAPTSGGGVPWVALGAVAVAALIGLGAVVRGRRAG
jgi:hypothetical protein